MSAKSKLALLALVYLIVLILVSIGAPKELNWRDSFTKTDKIPFGCRVLHESLGDLFPNREVYSAVRTIYEEHIDSTAQWENYIFIDRSLRLDELDSRRLLDQVDQGSHLFLSANFGYQSTLLDTLGIYARPYWDYDIQGVMDSVKANRQIDLSDKRSIVAPYTLEQEEGQEYRIRYSSFIQYFRYYDCEYDVEVLGHALDSLPNFLRVRYGRGSILIHGAPEAMTNYHILDETSRPYATKVLSYLPIGSVYWDEYYKIGKSEAARTTMREVLTRRSPRLAWYIFLGSLLIYVLFYTKRKQRIIPIKEKFENKSLEYARTVGSMYYEEGAPSDILQKRMEYFRDFIARRFYLRDIQFSDRDAKLLSEKTGFPVDRSEKLFQILRNLKERKVISDGQLEAAVKRLNEFYSSL